MKCEWHPLGEYIESCDERNGSKYGVESVRGISINKAIIKTKADMEGVSLTPYKLLQPDEFCFVTVTSRNGGKISLACNESEETYIVSSSYEVFRIADKDALLPAYLDMLLRRPEFDRYARFNSWGSARETFSYGDMTRVRIPVPSIPDQKKIVYAWKGLRKLKEENERLAEPLMQLCRSYMQELKKKWPMKEIGSYISEHDRRNNDLSVKLSQGVANSKVFQDPKQVSANAASDKIVETGQFAYNRATTRNGEKISIAFRDGPKCTVSGAYGVFSVTNYAPFISEYLLLWFIRPEFDRYARYMSKGSAHEFFEFADMKRVKIPLPPKEVQEAVVAVYRSAMEAKRIAAEADELSRQICPALIQHVVKGEN